MFRFRLLIVEDVKETLDQLVLLLQKALPGVIIDSARCVEDALQTIADALERGVVYDLAILDFKLPRRIGEHDTIDESICKLLSLKMPQTIVSHISAFHQQNPEIVKHLDSAHPTSAQRGFFLDKKSREFYVKILPTVRETLYGLHLEREIGRLFGASSAGREREGARAPGQQWGASVTNRIADLCLDIGATWKYLSSSTQAKVQEYFEVHDAGGEVSVTLK